MKLGHRRAEPDDYRLVVDSWVESYRDAHAAGMIAMDDWRAVMADQVGKVLARPGVEVIVAHAVGETDRRADVFGWLAVERGHVLPYALYTFVKHAYRRLGVARGMFRAAGIDPEQPFSYACKTGVVSRLASKIPHARWQPLVIRFPPPQESHEARQRAAAGS